MRACIVRKVPYRLAGSSRLLWALILSENQGLTLLLVRKPDDKTSHAIVIAAENVAERVFETVNVSQFPVEAGDLESIGSKLEALSGDFSEDEMERLFKGDRWE